MIHPAPLFVAAAAVFGAWLYFSTDMKRNPHKLPTPPGPKGWPFIGNMFDMPQKNAWGVVMKLRKQYGDLIFMNVLGTPILYINSLEVARELLDKRSSAYSDRPVLPMAGELCGYKEVTPLLPARAVRFRAERKLMHQYMGTRASVEKIADVEEEENARLCLRILRDPSSERLRSHIRKTAGGIILKLAYGYDPKEYMDPFVEQADRMLRQWDMATMPGAYLVDILPALKHIPEWFPGAGFKRFARSCNRELTQMFDLPFEWAMSNSDKSSEIPNLVSSFYSDSLSKEDARDVKMAAGNLYAGGTDTTVSASYCLFLILAKYPEVQARAQAELDRVVGTSRLPRMSDRSELPYIDAMVKELLRWNAVTPLAFPHMSSEDDTYDGYFIPKGTIVMPNTYCMLRDEATYRDPDRFNPDRFLSNGGNPPEQDPRDMCFGFGRRVCPGLYVADASLFMFCATIAAVFNVAKAVKDGVEVGPEYETIGTVITHPKHFEVSIDARSQVAVQLVKSAAELNE